MKEETQNEKCESVADLIKILGSTFFDEVPRDLYITFYGDKPPKIDLAKLEFTDYEKFEFFDIYGYYFFELNKIESLDSEKVANDPQLNALKLEH